MDNQHRKIKGYRELSQTEIDLMNEVKAKGVELGELIAKIRTHLLAQEKVAHNALANAVAKGTSTEEAREESERLTAAEALRWAAIAKTDLQTGLMALTRSIAQPGFF